MTDIEFVNKSTVELLDCNASDIKVARAAWVSQDAEADRKEAEEGRVRGLIDFLWRNRHTSPFEHGQFSFKVETPLFIAREFMRHRTFSYNEVSARYVEMKPRFYVPPVEVRPLQQTGKVGAYTFSEGTEEQQNVVEATHVDAAARAWEAYEYQLKEGVAKEVARMVLPVSLMTTFWATVNPLNLMKFLDLRTDSNAMYEIRDVAEQMEIHLFNQMPLTFEAWTASSWRQK